MRGACGDLKLDQRIRAWLGTPDDRARCRLVVEIIAAVRGADPDFLQSLSFWQAGQSVRFEGEVAGMNTGVNLVVENAAAAVAQLQVVEKLAAAGELMLTETEVRLSSGYTQGFASPFPGGFAILHAHRGELYLRLAPALRTC
ncbi:hypothetical protein [Roseomonas genomospecies 6]|uniref:Uncharacterized protein n=1 Tax=Roseomonas genomospecies 6 TaxID=214106 RepID=A0A9W7KQX1_9PROT|nr:hypothetical protein [Roseomonas genomospecies 6]KAA0677693.1 hypothetical protein DS843_22910 [Roseomonas genomospecies 6]